MENKRIIKIIVPIYGLGWVLNNIVINPKITIRFIDETKENDLLKEAGLNWIKYQTVLDINYKYEEDNINEPYPAIQFLLNKIESALRIYRSGNIGFAGIISKPKVSPFPLLINSTIPNRQSSYKMNKDNLKNIPSFYQEFEVAYQKKPIAFDYFSHAQDRYTNNDKTIDCCISLESIFVPENNRGSKKIFILQGLKILGFKQDDIQAINDLYDYRNTIIHADKNKQSKLLKGPKYTHKWFEECMDLIRKILLLYIKKPF